MCLPQGFRSLPRLEYAGGNVVYGLRGQPPRRPRPNRCRRRLPSRESGCGVPSHAGPRRSLPRRPQLRGPFGAAGALACAFVVSVLLVAVQNGVPGFDDPPSRLGTIDRSTPGRSTTPPTTTAASGIALSAPRAASAVESRPAARSGFTDRSAARAGTSSSFRSRGPDSGRKCGQARRGGLAKPGCPPLTRAAKSSSRP
jgi:hypothetical protein